MIYSSAELDYKKDDQFIVCACVCVCVYDTACVHDHE